MKILLDENLPKKLKVDFGPGHDIYTVGDMGNQMLRLCWYRPISRPVI